VPPPAALERQAPHFTMLPGLAPWRAERAVIAPFPRAITIAQIVELVDAEFGVTVEQIRGPRRTHQFVFARHVAQYLATRLLPAHSLPVIGRYFFRDHTSIMSARNKISRMVENNPATRALVERLGRELRNAQSN
jgi:chromosomal replication initiator protein